MYIIYCSLLMISKTGTNKNGYKPLLELFL